MGQQRLDYIDSAKGIGILLVVFAHVIAALKVGMRAEEIITSFHMPIFFVLSGLFFSRKSSFKEFVIGKTNRLVVPFVFFFILSCIPPIAWYTYRGTILEKLPSVLFGVYSERIFVGAAIWFLLALWFDNLLFYLVTLVKHKLGGAFLCLLFGTIGLALAYNRINLPFWFDTALTCIIYFAMGYLIKNYTTLLQRGKSDKYNLLFSIICIVVAVLFSGYTCYRANHFEIPFWQLYICGISGFFAVFFCAKSKVGNVKWLQHVGKNSLIILCIHQYIMTALTYTFGYLHFEGWMAASVNFLLTVAICCLLIPPMLKWLPHVTGQKALIKW